MGLQFLQLGEIDIDIRTVSSDHSIMYLENVSNWLWLKNNDLSVSYKPSNIVKAINNMGKSQGTLTYVSSDNVKQKLFNIMNAKLVKKDGKRMVKIEVSTEKLKATGKHAKEAIKITNFSVKKASLTILSSENNLLLPGVAVNKPPLGEQIRASPNTQDLGHRVQVDIGNQSIAITNDTITTYSMASWDEQTLTLRIWLRRLEVFSTKFILNQAVFPRFLLNAYNPLLLSVENGQLILENGKPLSDAGITLTTGPTIINAHPCDSSQNFSQNCLRLRF